jgi:hypothetical protein
VASGGKKSVVREVKNDNIFLKVGIRTYFVASGGKKSVARETCVSLGAGWGYLWLMQNILEYLHSDPLTGSK